MTNAWSEPEWAALMADLASGVGRMRADERRHPRPIRPPIDGDAAEWDELIRAVQGRILDDLYPAEGSDQERNAHLDLAGLGELGLRNERDRLRLRLFMDRAPDPWLYERLEALEAQRKAHAE